LDADNLAHDPRIAEARRLVLEALAEHQQSLTGIRPSNAERQMGYAQAVRQIGELRGGELYYPYLGSGFGRGALVELADGSVKYDMISGIGVHYLGHNHPLLVSAGLDAALQDAVQQGNLQQNIDCLPLMRMLIDAASSKGATLAHAFLSSSGAMANENALKIIFQKRHPSERVLAFEGAFAGRTLALAQITDKPPFRHHLPETLRVDYIPFFDARDPEGSTRRATELLARYLTRYPRQYAVMCLELIQGEHGFYPGDRAFFVSLLEQLKKHEVAVWIDEVQTFGRTGELFAFQHFGLDGYVDVVTVGKLLQVCATLFTEEYKPRPGLLSQTFTASSSAIMGGQAILNELMKGGYFGSDGKIERVRRQFVTRLQVMAARHPQWVSGPFGVGAMIAFTPFGGDGAKVKRLLQMLFQNGVIAFEAGETVKRVRFLPPVGAITSSDIDAACEVVERTLEEVSRL
jgi:4-aminobutyrate aminotransferase-like enzyme